MKNEEVLAIIMEKLEDIEEKVDALLIMNAIRGDFLFGDNDDKERILN